MSRRIAVIMTIESEGICQRDVEKPKVMQFVRYTITAFVFGAGVATEAIGQDTKVERPVLRVVFFTPSDVEPPDGVRERLKEYVDYSQAFYAKWMTHWGYECEDPVPVNLDDDGFPEILFVKGRHDQASGAYRQLGFQSEVVEAACRKYKLRPQGQVWWIYMFKGPERRGFRGGGNARRGGTSTAIFDPAAEGSLRLTDELGSDKVRRNSKASIHELGHALGLPHIGPLENDGLGNSLMGPVVRAYANRFPNEDRVYLTEASAALLWKHPLFSGTANDRDLVPDFELKNVGFTYDPSEDVMSVSGSIKSEYKAHSVVIANEPSTLRSDYWRKCFVGRVAEDGSFEVRIGEPEHVDGRLRIVCCFNNGANVGAKSGLGLTSGFVKEYKFRDDRFEFVEGWGSRGNGSRARRGRGRPAGQAPRESQ